MAQVDWYIEGVEFSNCNCDYACPCQFESRRPTYGDCRGFAAALIDKGHFGDVALDGLGAALLYAWPGPIYDGNGECQAVIDERADGRQRDALAELARARTGVNPPEPGCNGCLLARICHRNQAGWRCPVSAQGRCQRNWRFCTPFMPAQRISRATRLRPHAPRAPGATPSA